MMKSLMSALRTGALLRSARVASFAAAALAMSFGPGSEYAQASTVKVVMQSGLRVTDPILSTAFTARDHGYLIYDTLLGLDKDFHVRPQMAEWKVSDDGKLYSFTLRS